jgi:hypothetical protein
MMIRPSVFNFLSDEPTLFEHILKKALTETVTLNPASLSGLFFHSAHLKPELTENRMLFVEKCLGGRSRLPALFIVEGGYPHRNPAIEQQSRKGFWSSLRRTEQQPFRLRSSVD